MPKVYPERPKVFGIGFHKTGTTSLASALAQLGWRVCPGFGFMDDDIEGRVRGRAAELVQQFDAFEDNPWPILFRELDQAYPRSKFIATWRDPERWYASVLRHFKDDSTPMRRWIYGDGFGSPHHNKERYISRYIQHYDSIKTHFSDRPNDLLWMRFEEGDGWEQLCRFLDMDIPGTPFPHSNANAGKSAEIVGALKRSGPGRLLRWGYQKYVKGYGLKMR